MKEKYVKPHITVAAIDLAYGVMEGHISPGEDYTGGNDQEAYSKEGPSISWDLEEEEDTEQ